MAGAIPALQDRIGVRAVPGPGAAEGAGASEEASKFSGHS